MNLFAELKRRNVFKVAVAYIIVGWLILQVGEVLGPALRLPDWVNSTLAFFIILGLPVALIFAWAFEMTPEGLKKEKDIDRKASITHVTGQKLNYTIIALLVLALGYLGFDKLVLDPGRDAAEIDAAVQQAQEQLTEPVAAADTDRSIAVLPFVNMSDDAGNEYFSDGLSEELLNLLARIPELRVAARTSSFSFKGQNIEIPEIAKRLGVANVLEGSVRKSGQQIRITAQLIKADDGFHLWSQSYDRKLDNIFHIQDEIAEAVVDSLKVTLLGEAPKSRETDPEAYQLYLEGQYIGYQRTPESFGKAIELFKEAVAIDPAYAPAWAELAYSYLWHAGTGGIPIEEGNALADQAIEMALNSDPDYGWTHYVKGVSLIINKFEFKEGAESYRRAYELDAGNALIRSAMANASRLSGRLDESIAYHLSAIELDPILPELHGYAGVVYWAMSDLENAKASFNKALSLSPNYVGIRHRLARVYMQEGDLEGALKEATEENSQVYRLTSLSMVQFAMGNREEAEKNLAELIRIGADPAAYQIAEVYASWDEADKTFEWLEQSYINRDSGLAGILGDPAFWGLMADHRWEAFLAKLNLDDVWRTLPPEWGGPRQ